MFVADTGATDRQTGQWTTVLKRGRSPAILERKEEEIRS